MGTKLEAPGTPGVLYLVDLSSYAHRAYHAIAPLNAPSGEATQAVHGTVNMLERLVRERRPQLMAIALDSGRKTFRSELYKEYKANRPPAPPDLKQQLLRCEQFVRASGLRVFKQDGVEADDLIATAVRHAKAAKLKVVIVGADKDLMQLIDEDVVMLDTMRDRVFGVEEVEHRYGVKVAQLGDLLALMGDSSDNIPGVPSVGPKTAKDLLTAYDSIDGIYDHLPEIARKKLRETLEFNRAQATLSRQLVSLKSDCELAFDVSDLTVGPKDVAALSDLYRELGFARQLKALKEEQVAPATPPKEAISLEALHTISILGRADLAALLEASSEDSVAAHFVSRSPSAKREPSIGLSLATRERAGYVPLAHRYLGAPPPFDPKELANALSGSPRPITSFAVHGAKRSLQELERLQVQDSTISHDTELASYLLEPDESHELESVAERELGLEVPTYESVTKVGKGRRLDLDEVDIDAVGYRAGARAFSILSLVERQTERLKEHGLHQLYTETEQPLTLVLKEMERTGVLIDTERLHILGKRCSEELTRLETLAHQAAGKVFNVHAPRQLETLLFDELGLKPLKRTKTSRSTDAQTLETLSGAHPLPKLILEIRQVAKLKSTYIDTLPDLVNEETGRVHCDWHQTTAATGRLSCTDPNLQNIPIKSDLGLEIRSAFVAAPGYALVSADYSQIELRVLAHLSQDPRLLEAFRTGQDIHTRTAMEIFGVAENAVTREERGRAKAVNFGVIYGQGDSALAKTLGITRAEAGDFIAAYFRRYDTVRSFMNQTLDQARAGETVRSVLGRRRTLPDIRSGNRGKRLAAERIAMNMPIQGSAADILKLAMLRFKSPVTPGSRMIMTVHDEIVFEVPKSELAEALPLIKHGMENAFPLSVPLSVDVGHGADWREAH